MTTTKIEANPLVTAVNAVMLEVPRVAKTGKNTHMRYDYSSEQDLLEALRPAMARNGLSMTPGQIDVINTTEPNNRGNYRVDIKVTFNLLHVSGIGSQFQIVASGTDNQDKAFAKAMTMALKYALINAFLVPRGDDPDRDGWSLADDPTWIKLINSIEGGAKRIKAACAREGWPTPSEWDQTRLNRFAGAYNRGDVEL